MARASDTLSIIFTIIILVSILFLCDIIHGRAKLLTSEPNNDKPGLKETVMVGGQVSLCLIPNGPSCLVIITWQDQAMPKSTNPSHSPGIGDSPSGSENFGPTDPGYSPGTGDSTGLNVPNLDHP